MVYAIQSGDGRSDRQPYLHFRYGILKKQTVAFVSDSFSVQFYSLVQ